MPIVPETILITLIVMGTITVLNCASYTCLVCTSLCCNFNNPRKTQKSN